MIVYDLKCVCTHQFEAWFRSSSDFDAQKERGLVECPACGGNDVSKAIMAPNVGAKSNTGANLPSAAKSSDPKAAEMAAKAQELLGKLREHVEQSCDYVGNQFADEARKIHYGESEERGIYGESTPEETKELLDEGVEILPLPAPRRTDA